jgi:hypothetical protein
MLCRQCGNGILKFSFVSHRSACKFDEGACEGSLSAHTGCPISIAYSDSCEGFVVLLLALE